MIDIVLKMAALSLPFFLANMAFAACYFDDGPSGRLSNYCAIQLINGQRIDNRSLRLVDYKLKMEGNTQGLGLPTKVKKNTTQRFFSPLLFYSNNINGGNSSKPLKLGNLTFEGEEELFRKVGMLAGGGAGFRNRYIYNDGGYLQYNANISYAYSPKHKLGVGTVGARACDIRRVLNSWYLDSCAGQSRTRKDLSDTTNSELSFVTSNHFKNFGRSFSQVDFGVKRFFTKDYTQNQVVFGFDTIHSNDVFTNFGATFGEAITAKLATRLSLGGRIIVAVADKPLSLSATYTDSGGGIMLGVSRSEKNYRISASYPIWQKVKLSVGYKKTDSTIDHYNLQSPTLGLELPTIQF